MFQLLHRNGVTHSKNIYVENDAYYDLPTLKNKVETVDPVLPPNENDGVGSFSTKVK